MQYSPKLKKAMEEIKKILHKNDIAGIVVLHTVEGTPSVTPEKIFVQGFSEFYVNLETTYSATKMEQGRLIIKGKKEHWPTPVKRDIQITNTVNMLEHLIKIGGQLTIQIIEIDNQIKPLITRLGNDGGNFSSHTDQNN